MTAVGALAALKDRQPVKWLLDRLVTRPIDEALESKVTEIVRGEIGHKVDRLATQVDTIYHEMHPNSSLSMRDAIDRTEHRVAVAAKQVDVVDKKVDEIGGRVSKVEGQVDILARRQS